MKKLLLLTVPLAIGLLAAPSAQAITYDLTSDHVTGGAGTPPFGTVSVTQNGANVDITVDLADGYSFVKTGAADDQAFKFNGTGVALGDITVDAHTPTLVASTGAFNGDGTGNFAFGINAPSQGPGGSDPFTDNIVFHVANATIADLTGANALGVIFVADILAPNGNTGPVDVSGPPDTVPDSGSTFALMCLGLLGIGLGASRRRKVA
jgi:hypothetical protein